MKRMLMAFAASLAIAAHADDAKNLIEVTKQAVAQSMKDPDSAQFKNMAVIDGKTRAVCGEVNARNSYGGYVGFRQFYKWEDSANVIIKKGDPIMDRLVDAICKPS